MRIARIVSGGQTGADRAALDAAIAHGLEYGGWCPAGGWAEDLPDPPGLLVRYPGLCETSSADPAMRTRLNVRDSHATVVVGGPGLSRGSDLAVETAVRLGRPYLLVVDEADAVRCWLALLGSELTLNVAGPRERERPGVYAATWELLGTILGLHA
ncbi:putative molybdenum carrier protein [Nocardioides panacihumi]|uniref:Molybdenum carrier protein n=1 Tax=Nocardioides panacihumi TaxID=400774 RepID=A0ABN2QAC2_9ACTN